MIQVTLFDGTKLIVKACSMSDLAIAIEEAGHDIKEVADWERL